MSDRPRLSVPAPATVIDFDNPPADPVALFPKWLADAEATGMPNPNAMSLATVDADGRPSCRIVLLKGFGDDGAVFYTNQTSRKGLALTAHPRAALVFHWDLLDRQVVIEGDVIAASEAEADAYFASRRRESRIGAWASQQSQPVADRASLEAAYTEAEQRFGASESDGPVPRPPHWGGYRVTFRSILYWQGHPFRLHDRVLYTPRSTRHGKTEWRVQRLFP